MSLEVGSIAAFLKSGIWVPFTAVIISVIAVVMGFSFFPLNPKDPMGDAVKRLSAGLFCSFTLGPVLTVMAVENFPWYLTHLAKVFPSAQPLTLYLAAAAPFLGLSALIGFWVIGLVVRTAVGTDGKTLGQVVQQTKKEFLE